jgi:hypothetical protein
MFMAQALRGSSGAYHNQLMGLVGEILSLIRSSSRLHVFATRMLIIVVATLSSNCTDQQPSLSQLASLAGGQGGGNGGGGHMNASAMGMSNLLNDNSNGSMNRMHNSMGGSHMGGPGSDRF